MLSEGPERPVLERLIRQHDLADSVRLLGLVDDMPAFYQNIDLFVMTSMHESLSLVCLEAMAWGLPVIAQCVDGIVEVVPNGQAGMLLPATLTIAEYAALTGASTAFARQVYDPLRDQLVVSQLLSPDDMADAVVRYRENTDLYMLHSKSALSLSKKWPGHSDFIGCIYTSLLRYL
ncbi:glycosyltransferase [Paludibacterium denitrificans]|uniref:glycosyltransferase n=1 Tax=Paludibacterium denitrificans TaxID=2675226 RepID=UPI0024780239|nr:glycosyltransferase [Paludibacterium denitrificans]